MAKLSSWKKFVLLLWKNWVLQWNHKTQLFVELLLPALFSLLLILVRSLVEVEHVGVTRYHEQNITSLDLFNASMAEHKGSTMPNFCLHYSPYNPILDNVVKEAADNLNMTHVSSADAKQLENDVVSLNNFAGIQFDDSMRSIQELPTNFNFTLRFPSELRTSTSTLSLTWLTKWLFIIIGFPGPRNLNDNDGGIPAGYLREGFLPIQHALSMAYIRQKSNVQTLPEVAFQRFPFPPFISDPIIAGLGGLLAMILLLSFIYPCTCITKYVTYEKEKQLKEVMKIMGLNNWLHWVAWFIKSFTMLAISTVFIVILLKVKFFDDVAVLTYANGFVLFVFMLVYITVTICFCFMMATLFSRASTAAAVTGLIWFIIYIPYLFLLPKYDTLTLGDKLGWCLILNTAMSFGFKIITEFEATGEGIQWNNIFSPVNVDDNLSLGYVMIMMLLSSVVYILICLYMEQIFPGDFGIPRKWYFPFTRSFWCGTKYIGVDDLSTSEQRDPNSFEREPVGKPIGIQVRNLKKTFGKKMAVRGISANMYEDEITVLLGHNGAGKTTTISMLTGMFPPTSGTAIINGSDIRKNIDSARMSMGICPQHNVLFDDMSVANHLRFFSWLKGLQGKEVTDEVNKYLKIIQLENKATAPAKTLSGGMMRKLSLCCALTGNTKVVLCDEPSSGMDPAARRQLWDMLQAEKMGRTILLTTHFMDEADVLGDRIAIMCDGELKCFGTSFFLKKHYGSGYKLICVKKDNCEPANVTALLNNYVPGIQPKGNIGTELSYDLPDKYSDKFEEMLSELEKRSKELNLDGYGIGITSLEEVFMKVGADSTGYDADYEQKEINDRLGAGAGIHDGDNESMQSDAAFTGDGRALHGMKLSANQWRAMMLKKMLYTYRNKVILVLQNVVAPLFVVMTVLIARTRSGYLPQPSITIGLKQYPVGVTVLERMPSLGNNTVSDRIATHYEELANSFGSDYTFESTGSKTFSDYILELGESIQVRINSRYLAAASIGENKIVTWLNNLPLHTAPLTVNMAHNAIAREVIGNDVQIGVSNYPLPYSTQTVIQQINIGNNLGSQLASNICFCMCFITTIYILFIIKERESRAKLLQFVSGVRVLTFWFSQFIWDFATYAVTALLIVLAILCFQEPNFKEFDELGRYYLVLLLFGCSALPFTYILAHWFKEPATGFSRVVILKIFAGMAMFIVVLFTSAEIFNAKKESDIIASVFRLFPHFSVAMGLNKVAVNQALRSACKKVSGLPPILICELLPSCCGIPDYFEWEYPGILPEIVYLVVTAIVYFAIIIFCEYGFHNKPLEWISGKPKPVPPIDNIDDDVQHERQRILDMSQREIAIKNLVLDRVCKYYGNFLAVNQVSLCVEKSECFGLLGVNGAGKTTLFKMMTGDQQISMGDAYLQGMNLKDGMNRVYQKIGYCPQFDALLDDLTGREMLKIFCLLRGIQSSRVKQVSEELAILFGFIRHIDKMTKAFSGGNKRKLNAAIAVLGSPSVIYLDEPTTGMDPAARRHLWNVVCRIRDSGKSIVLTSHSMEECEALCTRLAIMVNGELKCIGSTQHLKNKFSKGIVLKIKLQRNLDPHNSARYSVGKQWLPEPDNSIESIASTPVGYDSSSATTPVPYQNTSRTILRRSVGSLRDPQSSDENMTFAENNEIDAQVSVPLCKEDIDRVKEFVFLKFPQSVLQEEYQGMLTFYIPLDGIKWSKMFGIMERNRNDLNIEDYSISQTTLEEIFLEFAKHQREDKRIVK